MKLHYRGISYDHKPATLEVSATAVEGKFRGQKWTNHKLTQIQTAKPSEHLVYRGVVIQ